MADNISNVEIPQNTWVDLYAATGIAVGSQIVVENIGNNDVYLAVLATQPANDHAAYNVVKRPPSPNTMQNSEGDPGAWAYCPNSGGKLAVSAQVKNGFLPVTEARLTDGFGNPLSSYFQQETGSHVLSIHDADVHTQIINRLIHQHTTVITTLTVATSGDGTENQITVASVVGFAIGDHIHVNTTSIETTHPVILAINGNVFQLDRYLDRAHAIGDEVIKVFVNMSPQIGTLAAPREYWTGPPPGEVWHITRLLFEMTHGLAGDLGKFGGIDALINGVLLRARNNGQYGTFTNWKTNGNIKTDMFDVVFDARSGGQGSFGTSGRGTFTNTGAIVRLDGDTNDRIELYVQDDLQLLDSFTMKIQGHLEVG